MRNNSTVYLVGVDFDKQSSLVAALSAAGLHLQTFPSAEDFTSQYKGDEFGCLLLEWRPGDCRCAHLLKKLSDSRSGLSVIIIVEYPDATVVVECMRLMTMDRRRKDRDHEVLLTKIRHALEKTRIVRSSALRLSVLTPREREMLRLLIEGKSSKQITAEKGLSLRTVKKHRSHMLAKTGAENTADLVRLAMVADDGHVSQHPLHGATRPRPVGA